MKIWWNWASFLLQDARTMNERKINWMIKEFTGSIHESIIRPRHLIRFYNVSLLDIRFPAITAGRTLRFNRKWRLLANLIEVFIEDSFSNYCVSIVSYMEGKRWRIKKKGRKDLRCKYDSLGLFVAIRFSRNRIQRDEYNEPWQPEITLRKKQSSETVDLFLLSRLLCSTATRTNRNLWRTSRDTNSRLMKLSLPIDFSLGSRFTNRVLKSALEQSRFHQQRNISLLSVPFNIVETEISAFAKDSPRG